jgi:hypothetical protein
MFKRFFKAFLGTAMAVMGTAYLARTAAVTGAAYFLTTVAAAPVAVIAGVVVGIAAAAYFYTKSS